MIAWGARIRNKEGLTSEVSGGQAGGKGEIWDDLDFFPLLFFRFFFGGAPSKRVRNLRRQAAIDFHVRIGILVMSYLRLELCFFMFGSSGERCYIRVYGDSKWRCRFWNIHQYRWIIKHILKYVWQLRFFIYSLIIIKSEHIFPLSIKGKDTYRYACTFFSD